jgi:uncharacterized protein YjdB
MKRIFIFLVAIFCIQTAYAQTRILPLGESTTQGPPAWRKKFCQLLTADGLNYDMVGPKNDEATDYDGNHAGFSGYNSSAVQAQVESFYSSHPADMVLIWEGTNDCAQSNGGSTAALSSLIDKVCQLYPNAKVLVASIPPMSNNAYVYYGQTPGVAAANAVAFNNALPGLCQTKASEGKKVTYVDATSLTLANDISGDGIHPNQTGYDKMGTIFYNAVKNNLVVTAVSSVTVVPSTATISNVGTVQLTATVLPAGASYKNVTWSSNNTSVATVNSTTGLVTAVANGSAVITATSVSDNTKKGTCTVTVTSPAAVTSVSVSASTASVAAGSTVALSATVSPTNALQGVTWSSDNSSVASVSSSGVVSGLFVGTAVIKATSTSDATKSASTTVTVTAPPSKTEAENATFAGGAKKASDHTGYSGTGFVAGYESVGASVTFNVYAPTAGSYNVTLRYANANGSDKTISIYVNGTKIRQTSLASLSNSNWDTWGDKVEALTLTAGVNTIMYKYDSGDNGQVNLDYIDIASNTSTDPGTTSTLFTGTASGSAGYNNESQYAVANAFDANTNTFFAPGANTNSSAQLDLGTALTGKVTQIRFFPRPGFAYRMKGGVFQGSTNGTQWTTLHTVSSSTEPAAGWNSVTISDATFYRYFRYFQANNYADVAEIEFRGTTQSTTTTGSVTQETWTGVTGRAVSNIPVNSTTNKTTATITSLESTASGDNYGVRIRGYIVPTTTANYYFYIASDDNGEFWLSSDDQPSNKGTAPIAKVTDWTNSRQWNKDLPNQKSAVKYLQAGSKYYFEALMKEEGGGDNLAIGWTTATDNTGITVIGSSNIAPYICSGCRVANAEVENNRQEESLTLQLHPNPASQQVSISLAGFEEESSVLVQMRDMSGKSFLRRQVQPKVEGKQVSLSVGHLPQGLFFVTVQGSKVGKTAKLIITQ